jgi:hypothetical protein
MVCVIVPEGVLSEWDRVVPFRLHALERNVRKPDCRPDGRRAIAQEKPQKRALRHSPAPFAGVAHYAA